MHIVTLIKNKQSYRRADFMDSERYIVMMGLLTLFRTETRLMLVRSIVMSFVYDLRHQRHTICGIEGI